MNIRDEVLLPKPGDFVYVRHTRAYFLSDLHQNWDCNISGNTACCDGPKNLNTQLFSIWDEVSFPIPGNNVYVRPVRSHPPCDLHQIWDGDILSYVDCWDGTKIWIFKRSIIRDEVLFPKLGNFVDVRYACVYFQSPPNLEWGYLWRCSVLGLKFECLMEISQAM